MEFKLIKPTVKHIALMQQLVQSEVSNGNILERSSSEMATTIRSYCVAYDGERLVGFVALHIHTTELAEIRSLVVHKDCREHGLGTQLIHHAINEARSLHIQRVLVLTYQQKLFQKNGFEVIEKESIPETKIWADCVKCKHFPICDEIALMMEV